MIDTGGQLHGGMQVQFVPFPEDSKRSIPGVVSKESRVVASVYSVKSDDD